MVSGEACNLEGQSCTSNASVTGNHRTERWLRWSIPLLQCNRSLVYSRFRTSPELTAATRDCQTAGRQQQQARRRLGNTRDKDAGIRTEGTGCIQLQS